MNRLSASDPIVALSTPAGIGALGLVRMSGNDAIGIAGKFFSKNLQYAAGNSVHVGRFADGDAVLDEVVLTVFRAPHSFTKEDVVEISFHGSAYILQRALELICEAGARPAEPGEFTKRAWLNGALDLSQAEAVADLIASESQAAHNIAMGQLRGGISYEIKKLRSELLDFVSLIELELDFGDEDVEFADPGKLLELIAGIRKMISGLAGSFRLGNAIRNGIQTVIAGRPNAGKSTLLNALLKEERAIVSAIPGTTRDTIEEMIVIGGIRFLLIDTAGIREAKDQIEEMGIARTMEKIGSALILIYLYDQVHTSKEKAENDLGQFRRDGLSIISVANKCDMNSAQGTASVSDLRISALKGEGLEKLKARMLEEVKGWRSSKGGGIEGGEPVIISNLRHWRALVQAGNWLEEAEKALRQGLSGEMIAVDIRGAIQFLGEITGEIATDEILGNIFGKFCIGK